MNTLTLNIALAVLPTLIILAIILSLDRFIKEPIGLLVKLFVIGMLAIIPAILLEQLLGVVFNPILSYASLLAYALINIALVEEGVKYAGVRLFAYKSPYYDERFDGIIYCVMVSLGFATVENILYVIESGTSTALVRAITAVPAHAIFAVVMGYYMSLGKVSRGASFFFKAMSVLAPVALHGIYDFILFANFDYALLIFVPYLVFLYIRSIKLIKRTYDMEPFDPEEY